MRLPTRLPDTGGVLAPEPVHADAERVAFAGPEAELVVSVAAMAADETLDELVFAAIEGARREPGTELVDLEPAPAGGAPIRTAVAGPGPEGATVVVEQWWLAEADRCWTVSALAPLSAQATVGPELAGIACELLERDSDR